MKTVKWIVAMAAAGLVVPAALAQSPTQPPGLSTDQQVVQPKPVKQMTPEEKKADKEAKRKGASAGAPAISTDQQVVSPKNAPKMTAEEKKKDKEAKRKGSTPEEQAKQAKQLPGG